MNKTNIALLESGGYKYIIGARIKNETEEIRQWILSMEKYDGCFYECGQITKENINKRGYNKFLEISDNVKVSINQDKINEDGQWDGLKGYLTNTELPTKEVYEQYSGLWQVERAFRITKGTLELRPMFHFTSKRIEAHVCICFVAYKVYKELERILQIKGINMSVDKALDIAKTITALKIHLPLSNETMIKTMLLTKKHQSIALLYNEKFRENM